MKRETDVACDLPFQKLAGYMWYIIYVINIYIIMVYHYTFFSIMYCITGGNLKDKARSLCKSLHHSLYESRKKRNYSCPMRALKGYYGFGKPTIFIFNLFIVFCCIISTKLYDNTYKMCSMHTMYDVTPISSLD